MTVSPKVQAKPRLLFIVNAAWFFLSHRLEIARAAVADGYDVHLAAEVRSEDEAAAVQALGVTLHPVPIERGGTNPLADLVYFARLLRLLRSVRADIVHAVTAKPVLYGGLAARMAGAPRFIAALSGLGYSFTGERADGILARVMSAAFAFVFRMKGCRVILQNEDDVAQFVSARIVAADQVCLIRGSGVDLDRFQPAAEPLDHVPLRVVLPARMLRDKGVFEFAAAAGIVRTSMPNAEFLLAGPLDPANPSRVSREELDFLERTYGVKWIGAVMDMPALYASAHVVCLPSYREGLPKALIEACAVGRAIVTTDVPGCREVVRDQHNGLLVPVRDVQQLAVALHQLLGDRALRDRLGRHGQERAVAEFDVRAVVSRTLALYAGASA